MTTHKTNPLPGKKDTGGIAAPVDDLLQAALRLGHNNCKTGRHLVTFEEGAGKEGLTFLKETQGMRLADARDFNDPAAGLQSMGDADALVLPEIGVALVTGSAAQERSLGATDLTTGIRSVEPEYFVFAENGASFIPGADFTYAPTDTLFNTSGGVASGRDEAYLRGFLQAAAMIAKDLQQRSGSSGAGEEIQVLGDTWGLKACKVPASLRSGSGIRVAVLDDGIDAGHPDFAGRSVTAASFVAEPAGPGNHGTHMTGTACGPKAPAGTMPRYGIAYKSSVFSGRVLNGSGVGTTAGVLAGINWAVANRCAVILVPLAMQGGPLAAFTAAGQAALNNGSLIIAGSSSVAGTVGAPANSPTILSVGALGQNLAPAPFSPAGKIDIAAPGVSIFSAAPRPVLYQTWSGLASAAAHVAGCAALWAETAANLRGQALWNKLKASAKVLPFPPLRVGAGLVQAP